MQYRTDRVGRFSSDEKQRQALSRVKVLLSVENPYIRTTVRTSLAEHDLIQVDTPNNQEDILETLRNGEHDLIILNDEIGGSDSSSIIRSIREGNLGPYPFPLIIVLMSNGSLMERLATVMQSGPDDIVLMPLTAASINSRISRLMRGRKPFVVAAGAYLGPDRRNDARDGVLPTFAKEIDAPHPIVLKASGASGSDIQLAMKQAARNITSTRLHLWVTKVHALLTEAIKQCAKEKPNHRTIEIITVDLIQTGQEMATLNNTIIDPRFTALSRLFKQKIVALTNQTIRSDKKMAALSEVFEEALLGLERVIAFQEVADELGKLIPQELVSRSKK